MTSEDQKARDAQINALDEMVRRELAQEAKDLTRVFNGDFSEIETVRKLNTPHILGNHISQDGEDDDDDFRPY